VRRLGGAIRSAREQIDSPNYYETGIIRSLLEELDRCTAFARECAARIVKFIGKLRERTGDIEERIERTGGRIERSRRNGKIRKYRMIGD
jgi:hypothetical protein